MPAVAVAAIAWTAVARAQQPMPVIGYLSGGSPESDNIPDRLTAFRSGLSEMGFAEGQNTAINIASQRGNTIDCRPSRPSWSVVP